MMTVCNSYKYITDTLSANDAVLSISDNIVHYALLLFGLDIKKTLTRFAGIYKLSGCHGNKVSFRNWQQFDRLAISGSRDPI